MGWNVDLIEHKTAKTHGKLMVASGTLFAVTFFADQSGNYEVLGVSFEPYKAHIVLALLVFALFTMWLHSIILDDRIQQAKDEIKKLQETLHVKIPRQFIRLLSTPDGLKKFSTPKENLKRKNWKVENPEGGHFNVNEKLYDYVISKKNELKIINEILAKLPSEGNRGKKIDLDMDIDELRRELAIQCEKIYSGALKMPFRDVEKKTLRNKIYSFYLGYFIHNGLAYVSVIFAVLVLAWPYINNYFAPDIQF